MHRWLTKHAAPSPHTVHLSHRVRDDSLGLPVCSLHQFSLHCHPWLWQLKQIRTRACFPLTVNGLDAKGKKIVIIIIINKQVLHAVQPVDVPQTQCWSGFSVSKKKLAHRSRLKKKLLGSAAELGMNEFTVFFKFQKIYDIASHLLTGESGSVPFRVADNWMNNLVKLTVEYTLKDACNVDETAMLYRAATCRNSETKYDKNYRI